MKNIFDVNLRRNNPPEHSIVPEGEPYASLALPAELYALWDALEKVGLDPGDEPHWHISSYHLVNLVISEEQGSIYELNALARKLSDLDGRQVLAYRGLMELDVARNRRPGGAGRPAGRTGRIGLERNHMGRPRLPRTLPDGQNLRLRLRKRLRRGGDSVPQPAGGKAGGHGSRGPDGLRGAPGSLRL